ncbi:MAG: adenine deaminase C-terminal domain-containing protein, partial [Bacteroidota bacterium]
LPQFPDLIMFCSDDKDPDDLILGQINQLVERALAKGCDLFDVLRAACVNPVEHYGLDVGLLRVGDPADFILVEDLRSFKVLANYINGQLVAQEGQSLIQSIPCPTINNFSTQPKSPADFQLTAKANHIRVIKALDGEIITESFITETPIDQNLAISEPKRDILKIAVINRYSNQAPALAFIHGFGLSQGAIASCVGHDSHNIIAVGVTDQAICKAVNLIIHHQGGIAACTDQAEMVLPLPIAGILSNDDAFQVAKDYAAMDAMAKNQLHSSLSAPFMTLSFMGLLVIPELKLSDLGLFDGKSFQFIDLFVEEGNK